VEQSATYQRFREAAESLKYEPAAVERMSADTVRVLADIEPGQKAATFVENMRQKLARQLRARMRQATIAWVVQFVRQRFAAATVRMPDDKVIVIYLDGDNGEVD